MYSVPFSIDEYEGFVQTRGIVRIEEEAVGLEFKKQEGSPKPSCGKWTINDAPAFRWETQRLGTSRIG